jgi:hypothetical protein
MLRALRREGKRVVLVTDGSKGRLAAQELGVEARDAEQPLFNGLWRGDVVPVPDRGVAEVFAFRSGGTGAADAVWDHNLATMFPEATISMLAGRPDSPFAREWSRRGGATEARQNPRGDVILHVGAGSPLKRWPLPRFAELSGKLAGNLVAGEVEAERCPSSERTLFRESGGQFLATLESLAAKLRSARLVIACDSGPGHLAAQLGVPTLSLFGRGDPERWSPVGPQARVVAPESPSPIEWLPVDRALAEALTMLPYP